MVDLAFIYFFSSIIEKEIVYQLFSMVFVVTLTFIVYKLST